MKYLITKSGEVMHFDYIGKQNFYEWTQQFSNLKGKVSKVSDTLKDLCDTFVFDDGDGQPMLCTYEELIFWFNHSRKEQYKTRNCYGAIWVKYKGLIYIAKLNDEGKFELWNANTNY